MKKANIKYGYIEGILSSIINAGLFAAKLWVGIMTNSVAMIADAWHTLSDTFTSIVVIVGFWMSGRPVDRKHPFGHGRAELVSSLIVGILLGMVGIHFLSDSISRLRDYRSMQFRTISIFVFAVSVVLKEALAQFAIRIGKKIRSDSLRADGWHHRSDAIASALIIAGMFAGQHFWWVDGVLGLAVSILILYSAYDVVSSTSDKLLGETIEPYDENHIKEFINDLTPDACNPHHFHLHRYGYHQEVTMHLEVPGDYSISKGHHIASQIEKRAKERLNIDLTVHVDPKGQEEPD